MMETKLKKKAKKELKKRLKTQAKRYQIRYFLKRRGASPAIPYLISVRDLAIIDKILYCLEQASIAHL